jgi:hypothetical protein
MYKTRKNDAEEKMKLKDSICLYLELFLEKNKTFRLTQPRVTSTQLSLMESLTNDKRFQNIGPQRHAFQDYKM